MSTVIIRVLSKGFRTITKPVMRDKTLIIKTKLFDIVASLPRKYEKRSTRPMIRAHKPIIVTNTLATSSGLARIIMLIRIPIMPSISNRYQWSFVFLTLNAPTVSKIHPIKMEMAKYIPRATSVIPGNNNATNPNIIANTPFTLT